MPMEEEEEEEEEECVTPCSLLGFQPEERGSRYLRNVVSSARNYTVLELPWNFRCRTGPKLASTVNTTTDSKGLHAAVTDNSLFRSGIRLLLTLSLLFKHHITSPRTMIDVFTAMHVSCEM
jgi:hypothetical protein